MLELLAEIEARAKAATPGPCQFGIRHDRSMWMSLGNPKTGPHIQADWEFNLNNAEAFQASRTDIPRLLAALRLAVLCVEADDCCCCASVPECVRCEILRRVDAALRGEGE